MFRLPCFAAVLLLLGAASISAQLPTPAMPPASADTAAATPPPGAPDTVTLQYPNSDVQDVLRLYETLTGRKLVMDNFVTGKVNLFVSKPIPREEAIKIIEINLLMNGFTLVPAEGDIIKVIGTGKSPRTAGVPIISDEELIPDSEQVISFLFKLRFADPLELQQVLQQYLSPPNIYTSFLALPKSSAVLVTENSSVIRSLAQIINQVDIPPAEVVSEFIKLERADAAKVVEMLREIFERGNQPGVGGVPAPGGIRTVRPGVPPNVQPPVEGEGGAMTVLSEESIVIGKIKLAADVRTNRIHVITRPVNMPFVKRLIAEFDANVEFAKPVTRPLRYISAADVLPVLVQSLQEPGGNQQGAIDAANPAAPQQQANQQQPLRRGTGTDGLGTSSGLGTGGTLDVSEELSTQAVDTTPRAVTIGNSKIIADQRSNSIIVLGNREVVVKVMKILEEMDVKAPQVVINTVVGELLLRNNKEFGVDYFQGFRTIGPQSPGSPQGGIAGTSRNTGAPLANAGDLLNFAQLATAAAGGANVFINTGFGLAAIVRAFEETGRFTTISRPTIFTSNNKKAIIASGFEIPVPVNTFIPGATIGGVAQSTNIQFKRITLQLEVVPLINSEREVTLDILQKLDNVEGTTLIDGNQIPNISTRYIRTTVSAPNRSTILLGGLIIDRDRNAKNGIPVLSRIPLVGALFRNTDKRKERSELVVLMCPDVALSKLDLQRIRKSKEERLHFGPVIDETGCPDCPPEQQFDGKQLSAPDLPVVEYGK